MLKSWTSAELRGAEELDQRWAERCWQAAEPQLCCLMLCDCSGLALGLLPLACIHSADCLLQKQKRGGGRRIAQLYHHQQLPGDLGEDKWNLCEVN